MIVLSTFLGWSLCCSLWKSSLAGDWYGKPIDSSKPPKSVSRWSATDNKPQHRKVLAGVEIAAVRRQRDIRDDLSGQMDLIATGRKWLNTANERGHAVSFPAPAELELLMNYFRSSPQLSCLQLEVWDLQFASQLSREHSRAQHVSDVECPTVRLFATYSAFFSSIAAAASLVRNFTPQAIQDVWGSEFETVVAWLRGPPFALLFLQVARFQRRSTPRCGVATLRNSSERHQRHC